MKKVLLACTVAGFAGAGMFYSPYIGINGQVGIECLLCPHVLAPLVGYARLTILGGLLNAALFCCVALAVIGSYRLTKWVRSKRPAGGRGAVPV